MTIPFGPYKEEALDKVPVSYFRHLLKQEWLAKYGELRKVIEEEVKRRGRVRGPNKKKPEPIHSKRSEVEHGWRDLKRYYSREEIHQVPYLHPGLSLSHLTEAEIGELASWGVLGGQHASLTPLVKRLSVP